MISRMMFSKAPAATILIRLMVGGIFFLEGIQKFLYPDDLGVGRFTKIGIPVPEGLAAIPLLIDISVAILSTKIPIVLGQAFGMFTLPKLSRYGFLSMVHEARADFSMLLGLLFLLIVGAGKWSLDAKIAAAGERAAAAQ